MSRVLARIVTKYGFGTLIFWGIIIVGGIIGAIALYWVYYKLVLEKKFDQFGEQNLAPEKKQKYLAATAVYSVDPYSTMFCLKSYALRSKSAVEQQKQIFLQDWNIYNNDSAIHKLEHLIKSGHREELDAVLSLDQLHSREVSDPRLLKLVENAKRITVLNQNGDEVEIDENAIYKCPGIQAWDYFRGAHVARVCYNLGFLSEEETWHYLEYFSKQLKSEFRNWEEASFSFLLGRYLWSGDEDQEIFIDRIKRQFTNYTKKERSKGKVTLWQKFSLNSM
ncbi:DUF1266 domain-containing protein [Enterococcus sp. DIV0187]|uniref:DUF1266 domain-containing protein n=1 Tax=Enterococcus sp. DIV0187 TaxID=2774644 RepID=UPI003F207C88